jgi:hypothetical protein
MKSLKFSNNKGQDGTFSVSGKRYNFVNGVFEVRPSKEDPCKELLEYFKKSPVWDDYVPTAADKAIILEKENEELKKDLEAANGSIKDLEAANEELKKDLEAATKPSK